MLRFCITLTCVKLLYRSLKTSVFHKSTFMTAPSWLMRLITGDKVNNSQFRGLEIRYEAIGKLNKHGKVALLRMWLWLVRKGQMVLEQTTTVARKSSIGGLYVCAGGLDIEKLIKTSLIYSASYFDLGGLVRCLGWLRPPKPPRCDGTGVNVVKSFGNKSRNKSAALLPSLRSDWVKQLQQIAILRGLEKSMANLTPISQLTGTSSRTR